jgi:hypothetical protein
MGEIQYTMSRAMYDGLRFPLVWSSKEKKMVKKGKPLSKKEVLDIINTQFGLLRKVTVLNLI